MLEEMNFSRDDFVRSNWREIIATAERKTADSYGRIFYQAAVQNKNAGDIALYHVFLLLHSVNNLWLRPEERNQPFAPIWQGANGTRSGDISDLAESHISLLKSIFEDIDNPEIRSRVGDVIWTCQRRDNFQFAEAAVDAYLEAGESFLLSDDYQVGIDRYTRAIHLAASLGRNTRKFGEVVSKIEATINRYESDYSFFVGQLLELLYDYRQGDFSKNALIAESLAEYQQNRRGWHLARIHWNTAARWHRLSDNHEAAQNSQLKEAECYVFEAEDVLKSTQNVRRSLAAHHLQSAIEALRRIPGTEARQRELHVQMLQLQASSHNELGSISQEIDLTEPVEKALRAIKDKTFMEALFTFCLLGSPPSVRSLRETVERMTAEHPLLSLISTHVIDDRGRVIGRRSSLFSGTPEEIEAAKNAEMHQWARYEKDALSVIINAVRLQMTIEHKFELRDFMELTTNHPFIPPGRELIFSRGFQVGFQGDFLQAIHLLIPQVESSLRYLLNHQGVVTSRLSSEGIQEEMDLNALLEIPKLKEILGEDLIFDLQGSLTSRFGSNFRNLMAHGLLDQQAFYSHTAIYIWWMLLRLCCLPLIIAQGDKENENATTPS